MFNRPLSGATCFFRNLRAAERGGVGGVDGAAIVAFYYGSGGVGFACALSSPTMPIVRPVIERMGPSVRFCRLSLEYSDVHESALSQGNGTYAPKYSMNITLRVTIFMNFILWRVRRCDCPYRRDTN